MSFSDMQADIRPNRAKQKAISFVCESAENRISGGYIYNQQVFKYLTQIGWSITTYTPEQSLLIDPSNLIIIDSIAIEEFATRWGARPLPSAPILLCHLPPEKQVKTETEALESVAYLKSMIEKSHVITTGSACSSYMMQNYNLLQEQIFEVKPGLKENWQCKTSYSPLPSKLLVVANLIPNKGYEILLDSLSQLLELPWTLDIYGDEGFAPHYAQEILASIKSKRLSDRIRYHGTADQAAINAAMVNADLFVQLSPYEPYSMVSLEAIASGLPMLSAQSGEVSDFIESKSVRYLKTHTINSVVEDLNDLMTRASAYFAITPKQKIEVRNWEQVGREFANVIGQFHE